MPAGAAHLRGRVLTWRQRGDWNLKRIHRASRVISTYEYYIKCELV